MSDMLWINVDGYIKFTSRASRVIIRKKMPRPDLTERAEAYPSAPRYSVRHTEYAGITCV